MHQHTTPRYEGHTKLIVSHIRCITYRVIMLTLRSQVHRTMDDVLLPPGYDGSPEHRALLLHLVKQEVLRRAREERAEEVHHCVREEPPCCAFG